jgi:predicted lipoprotein with Yx(FWY)xxD motif
MKWSVVLGAGATGVLILLAVATRHLWLPHARAVSASAAPPPVATPPGITLELVTLGQAGAATPQIVFADAVGMTLYTYASDTVGKGAAPAVSACRGDCAHSWIPAGVTRDAAEATDWSVLTRPDGSRQWCYRGAPLYTFKEDGSPGDTKGENQGGGDWHVAPFLPGAGMALPDSITVRHLPDAGGTALATPEGLTLYVSDGALTSAARWRPFEAGAIATAAGDFSVVVRADGITQWAFRGRPLYLFDGDRKPGDARGIGVDDRFRVALIRRYYMPVDATIRPITGLGNALAMQGGVTLYERDRVQPGEDNHDFRSDHGPPALGRFYGTSTCDASCAQTWPPYTAPADAVASGYWTVLTRPDGTSQWAYKGFALYRYSNDAPGEARGNQSYELVRIDDAGPRETAAGARPPLQLSAEDEAAYVKYVAHGNSSGIGVGALFWHAVAP